VGGGGGGGKGGSVRGRGVRGGGGVRKKPKKLIEKDRIGLEYSFQAGLPEFEIE